MKTNKQTHLLLGKTCVFLLTETLKQNKEQNKLEKPYNQ